MPPPSWLPWHTPTVPIKAAISLQCVAWSFQIPYVPVCAKAFGATMTQVKTLTGGARILVVLPLRCLVDSTAALPTRRFSAEAHNAWPGAGDRGQGARAVCFLHVHAHGATAKHVAGVDDQPPRGTHAHNRVRCDGTASMELPSTCTGNRCIIATRCHSKEVILDGCSPLQPDTLPHLTQLLPLLLRFRWTGRPPLFHCPSPTDRVARCRAGADSDDSGPAAHPGRGATGIQTDFLPSILQLL